MSNPFENCQNSLGFSRCKVDGVIQPVRAAHLLIIPVCIKFEDRILYTNSLEILNIFVILLKVSDFSDLPSYLLRAVQHRNDDDYSRSINAKIENAYF